MEDILKFVSSEQSTRSKSFMFIWRILIAVIITNRFMNSHKYYFICIDLSFKEIIKFIYSIEFIVVVSVYLTMIFVFFWLIKFLGVILSLIFNCYGSVNEQNLNSLFRYNINNQQGVAYFRDRKSLEKVQLLAEECKQVYNPIFEFIENRLNVLFANSFLIHLVTDEIKNHNLYSWWLGAVFCLNDILLFIGIIVYMIIIFLNHHYDSIIEWIVNVSRRGYRL